ncbi:extended synaptotagmin-2-like isoform X2 [Anguilla anguilla]|uniref:extended synaptotagmin-2-like isoform X2 n=1 Tax=Anguilla anguilla TaxID=7936 RepID=UPI0015ABBBB4|nr:extended synaptotagmin-2-like isoform X2 [Anguilla anguilla]
MSGEATGAPLGPDPRKADSTGLTKENGQNVTSAAANPKTAVQAPTDLGDEPDSSLTDATRMWIKFAKTFAFLFPIYVLGYFEFSFSWILIGLAAFFWWKRNRGGKEDRITRAFAFLDEEERTTSQSVTTSDLPPWVHFPDVERVEWLNKTVKQMWPYICQFVEKLFRDTIEPAVKGANPHLSTFCFSKIDMGDKPLRVNGVKVYTENVDKRQIVMDLQISFVGNTEIDCDIKRYYCRAGIKSIQLHGVLRVIMDPLLGDMPLIGAVSVFFLKKPLLDINWTGLTNMLDIPGLNGLCDNLIQDIIYGYLVLPNRITIPLVGEARMAQLRFPMPKGILRVHFLEAQALEGKDKFLGGMIKGKSDPYGVLQIGNQLFQTKTIKDNLNPKWNEVYEAMVYEHSGQHLEVELFDEDPDKDDFLGSLMIDLSELHKEQKVDEWFVLEEVTTGKLHLKLEWLSLHATPEKLEQALMSIKAAKGQANDGLSSAVLVVYLDSARNLPSVFEGNLGCGHLKERRASGLVFCENTTSLYRSLFSGKKVSSDPSPFVQFTVGHKVFQSKTRYKTNEPVWEEAFTFLIHNPQGQELEVEVKDEKHECSLGTLVVPLSRLLEEEDMTVTQRFPLRNSAPSCTLKLKMALRVLCLEKVGQSDQPSSVQVKKANASPGNPGNAGGATPKPSPSGARDPALDPLPSSAYGLVQAGEGPEGPHPGSPVPLAESSFSASNRALSGSQRHLAHKESTHSLASDISNPLATQELQQRLHQLQNGTGFSHFPLGEVQLTIRHSSQRNKLIVVVHGCRNLISFTDSGSDPYVRLYLLPDKRRSGRRKTHTLKKNLNPVYDQTFEFSVSIVELHRRTLDVAVKNGGGLLSKHKGLLGKVLVDLAYEDISKGWTQWYELTEDGLRRTMEG